MRADLRRGNAEHPWDRRQALAQIGLVQHTRGGRGTPAPIVHDHTEDRLVLPRKTRDQGVEALPRLEPWRQLVDARIGEA